MIQTPADWVGRRIGVKIGSPTYHQYRALLEIFGIESSQLTEIPLGRSLQSFITGQVEVYPGAATNEVVTLELQGVQVLCVSAEDYGVPTMGNVMFATEETVSARPDVLRRFFRATMRGWEWCRMEVNRADAVAFLVAENPKLDPRKETRALDATLALVGNGSVDKGKLARIISHQTQLRGDPGELDVDELVVFPGLPEPRPEEEDHIKRR